MQWKKQRKSKNKQRNQQFSEYSQHQTTQIMKENINLEPAYDHDRKTTKKKLQNDYLYRVGRLQQNQILKERQTSLVNGHYQIDTHDIDKSQICDQEGQEDNDFFFQQTADLFKKKNARNDKERDQEKSEKSEKQIENRNNNEKKNTVKNPIICFSSQQSQEEQVSFESNANKSPEQKSSKSINKFAIQSKRHSTLSLQVNRGNSEDIHYEEAFSKPKKIQHQTFQFEEYVDSSQQEQKQNQDEIQENIGQVQEQAEETQSNSQRQQIKGVKITANPLEGNVNITIINKSQFLTSELPPGIIIKCVLRRSSSFFSPYTQFDLFLNNGLKHIVSGKRYPLASNEIFRISTEIQQYENQSYVGSIMTNTLHNNYWLLTPFKNPQKQLDSHLKVFISYDKIIPKDGQRPLKYFIRQNDQKSLLVDSKRKDYKIQYIEQNTHLTLINKMPLSNLQENIGQNSTKNVKIIDESDREYQYLTFQKQSDNLFEVNIQHPLSPLQAFAFVLTRFDAQLKK